MDTRTGKIRMLSRDQLAIFGEADRRHLMPVEPTAQQLKRMRVGRNDPCPCGSGKKFKKCHLGRPV